MIFQSQASQVKVTIFDIKKVVLLKHCNHIEVGHGPYGGPKGLVNI